MPSQDTLAHAWLKAQARGIRRELGLSIACSVATTVLMCLQAALLAWGLNAVIFRHATVSGLIPACSGYALLAVIRTLLSVAGRHFGFRAGREIVARIRARLTRHMQALGPSWLAGRSRGELVARLVDGIDALEPYFARYLPQLGAAAILPLVILAAVFPADWASALVFVLTAPLVPLFMVLLGDRAMRASQRRWTTLTRLGEQFFDALQGLVTLRLFGAGTREQALLASGGEAYRRETMAVLRVAFLSSLVLEFFSTISIAVVAVLAGFRLLWGDIEFTRGMFVLLLAPEFYLPLRALGVLRHARMDALAVAGEIADLLAQPLPRTPSSPLATIPPAPLAASFDGVTLDHAPGRTGLDGITLELPAGTTTLVVGESGAGKSTLLQALLGFATPRAGRILINGTDLASLDPGPWRQRIAWLPQRPHLFSGSVRDNLLLACPQADEDALQQAAAATGLDKVIASLPGGWDTHLGENGHALSGGQAQRIGLARILLREAPLWLLDEPAQHLDEDAAEIIQRLLLRSGAGRTVIWVAHRLTVAPHADAIVVMDHGRIVERGSHTSLLHRQGSYARLWHAQAA